PALEEEPNAVLTWTPAGEDDLPLVELFQAHGFEWVWLDEDQGAAFRATFAYVGAPGCPRFVGAFEEAATFRPLEPVVADLLDRSAPSVGAALPLGTLARTD